LLGFFFYKPDRRLCANNNKIVSPADGKVVVIEETEEKEFFNERRIQVSIFMSIWNAHINWSPIEGSVKYYKYHPGKFLIARNPKSSHLNERSTIVIETESNFQVLVRQIAGMVARRIVTYINGSGRKFQQGEEFGFIKFGSRVDIFLPLNTHIHVKLGDKVRGCKTTIASII
jgi:phosphatidylserine decarboxylase